MQCLVASDIHGITPALRSLLAPLGTIRYLSPWDNQPPPHPDETQNVAAFHAANGLHTYAARINAALREHPSLLIAFSVGAASAWHALAHADCATHHLAVLYYGSRIRDALHLAPRCPVHLRFAERESAFRPQDILPALNAAANTRTAILPGTQHGFMNPQLPAYDPTRAEREIRWLRQCRQQQKIVDAPRHPPQTGDTLEHIISKNHRK